MNIKLALLIFTIFLGLVMGNGALHPARAQSDDKTLAANKPGASLKRSAAHAKRRFDKIVDNGFHVKYQIGGKTITASVVGNKLRYLQSEKIKLDDGSVVVKAVTKDGAIEITTHYILDEKEQKLTIDRKIRNMSAKAVKVRMTGQYLDPKLVFGVQGYRGKDFVRRAAMKRLRAGQLVKDGPVWTKLPEHLTSRWREACHCIPPPPPCPGICEPGENYIRARLFLLTRDRMMLLWNRSTFLAPQDADTRLPKVVRSLTRFDVPGGPEERF